MKQADSIGIFFRFSINCKMIMNENYNYAKI